jgi:hypothetical protein
MIAYDFQALSLNETGTAAMFTISETSSMTLRGGKSRKGAKVCNIRYPICHR